MSLKVSQGRILKNSSGENELSLYCGELTPTVILQSINKLKVSFPRMSEEFFNILSERIVVNDFCDDRLVDAVGYVLDNFQYKELNVSDVIKFDKRTRLYSYNDVCNLVTKGQAAFSDFEVREVNGECYRIKKADLE